MGSVSLCKKVISMICIIFIFADHIVFLTLYCVLLTMFFFFFLYTSSQLSKRDLSLVYSSNMIKYLLENLLGPDRKSTILNSSHAQ